MPENDDNPGRLQNYSEGRIWISPLAETKTVRAIQTPKHKPGNENTHGCPGRKVSLLILGIMDKTDQWIGGSTELSCRIFTFSSPYQRSTCVHVTHCCFTYTHWQISSNYFVMCIIPPVKSLIARIKLSSLFLGSSILKETSASYFSSIISELKDSIVCLTAVIFE